MEQYFSSENSNSLREDMEIISQAKLLFPEDSYLSETKEGKEMLLDKFKKHRGDVWLNKKENDPVPIRDFLFFMNNFTNHFNTSMAGEAYRTQEHYTNAVKDDNFKDIADGIIAYGRISHPININEIFTDNIAEIYQKIYDAYLIMRNHTKEFDSEMYI